MMHPSAMDPLRQPAPYTGAAAAFPPAPHVLQQPISSSAPVPSTLPPPPTRSADAAIPSDPNTQSAQAFMQESIDGSPSYLMARRQHLPSRTQRAAASMGAPPELPGRQATMAEFSVGPPRYQRRVALLLGLTLFGVLPLMSSFSLTVLLCWGMVLYMLDYQGYTVATVWAIPCAAVSFCGAVALANLHVATTQLGPVLMLLNLLGAMLVTVGAALLHFRYLQEMYPHHVCWMERAVMNFAPVFSLPSLYSTSTALVGSRYAPFCLLVAVCAEHYAFFCPLRSSFLTALVLPSQVAEKTGESEEATNSLEAQERPSSAEERCRVPQQMNERPEAILFTVLVLLLPVMVYNAVQSDWDSYIFANLLNSLALFCGSITYLCLDIPRSLWFLVPPPHAGDDEGVYLQYDPAGILDFTRLYGTRIMASSLLVGLHWATYRILCSRYAYVFSPLPSPYNALGLLLFFYLILFVALEIKRLAREDSRRSATRTTVFTRNQAYLNETLIARAPCLTAAMGATLTFGCITGAPVFFICPSIVSVGAFNAFLIDRTNAAPMITFTLMSSLLLLWWMSRTYSFMVVDLRLLGQTTVMPTPLMAGSVLWCYFLSCMSFTVAFSSITLPFTAILILHALQLTWVEHILYSQKEENAYPAGYVLLTTAVGMLMARKLLHNRVLSSLSAAAVGGCYLAKLLTFVVEVTSSYYPENGEMPVLLAMEFGGCWWMAYGISSIAIYFEWEEKIKPSHLPQLLHLYVACCVGFALLTVRNAQRSAYDFITQSYSTLWDLPMVGTTAITVALLSGPFLYRHCEVHACTAHLLRFARLCAVGGIFLLIVEPAKLEQPVVSPFDYELPGCERGRLATFIGFILLAGSRVLPLYRLPTMPRVGYWGLTSIPLALGIASSLPYPTVSVFVCLVGFVALSLISIDLAHYHNVSSVESLIVFGLSVSMMLAALVSLGRIDLQAASRGNISVLWELHEQGRLRLFSIIAVVHLFVAIMLKARLSQMPLLPRSVLMTGTTASHVGIVCNYAVLLSVSIFSAINFWGNDNEPGLYVMFSLLLMLLVNDETLFADLHLANYRYFPTAIYSVAVLWLCTLQHGWSISSQSVWSTRMENVWWGAITLLPTVPSQVSLLMSLWSVAQKRAQPKMAVSFMHIAICAITLLFTQRKTVQWMAIVCICGQALRVFSTTAPMRPQRRAGVVPP